MRKLFWTVLLALVLGGPLILGFKLEHHKDMKTAVSQEAVVRALVKPECLK